MRIYNVDYGHYVENLKISNELPAALANIKCFQSEVDKWRVPRNRSISLGDKVVLLNLSITDFTLSVFALADICSRSNI